MKINTKNKYKVEKLALVSAIIQPLITLPQIIEIYSKQSAQDVSLLTWVGYLIFGIIFLFYGVFFNLKPILYGQIIWVSMQSMVIVGVLIYT